MGQYPYDCEACGGAYERCCTIHESDELGVSPEAAPRCDGGQFCWSDEATCVFAELQIGKPDAATVTILTEVFAAIGSRPLQTTYTGYGSFIIPYDELGITGKLLENVMSLPRSPIGTGFEVFCADNDEWNAIVVKAWCASCYRIKEKVD